MSADLCNWQLFPGDAVALLAPASGQKKADERYVCEAIDLLKSWQLNVTMLPNFGDAHYLSAPDAVRAEQLNDALSDNRIKAIFVTRGGYGCARLIEHLTDNIGCHKWLIGFSDITTLHLALSSSPRVKCLHGPNLATQQFLANTAVAANNRRSLYNTLFHKQTTPLSFIPLNALAKNCKADDQPSRMTGGCLTLLASSLGTPYEIKTTNKVLMIEEVGEALYRIDRMLTQLQLADKFSQLHALVFGDMLDAENNDLLPHPFFASFASQLPCPVYHCPQFGHGEQNYCWRYE